ncbi:MAG: molybdate ABC transporter substrate-binding protein [Aestuariivirga sp.]
MKFLSFALVAAFSISTIHAADLNIYAAASMKDALDEIVLAYKAQNKTDVVAVYGASGTLAKQIEAGAPADIFISADEDWMNYLADKKLIKPQTRADIIGNTLVLIEAKGAKIDVKLTDLPASLGQDKLALGEVTSVPAGKYAKAALEKLGLWTAVEKNVVAQENVRSALALVARGEAKLGIVYGSDAVAEAKVEVAAVFPEDSHAPIRYPAAVTENSTSAAASGLLAFIKGPEAQAIFKKDGFAPIP